MLFLIFFVVHTAYKKQKNNHNKPKREDDRETIFNGIDVNKRENNHI